MLGGTVLVALAAGAIGFGGLAGSDWQVVASQNLPASNFDQLEAVVSTGSSGAWAVGYSRQQGSTVFRALTERWNGSAWQIVPSVRSDPSYDTRLHALAATGASDVWAVGTKTQLAGYTSHGLFEHWDGHGWHEVAHAADEPANTVLVSVSADSPGDAWAAGFYTTSGNLLLPVIEHWNGTSWSLVTGAFGGQSYYDRLSTVSALAPNDVWAFGTTDRHPSIVAEHWNGNTWTMVPTPFIGYDSELDSVTALGPGDIWAVGIQLASQTLVEHWNGSSWSIVPSPNASGQGVHSFFSGVAALGPNDIWAAGGAPGPASTRTLVEHWDGSAWRIVSSPPADTDAELLGLAAGGGGPLLAVGYQNDAAGRPRTLGLQH
jgi:hypothetical protein